MRLFVWVVGMGVMLGAAGCAGSANVEQERSALLAADSAWAETPKDIDAFVSYFAPDATIYVPGMPAVTGTEAIREAFTEMSAAPGFSITWKAAKADVSEAGDVGYTTGTYTSTMSGTTEQGKYVTVWKKDASGDWKVVEDIFNADAPAQGAPAQHVMVAPGAIKWGDGPPSLPPGARMAVISGDPTQAQPFVLRAQVPAGYRVPLHWHPTTENLTILTGTVSLGMGEQSDQMTDIAAGGFVAIPAEMRHVFVAKTAATFQVHGMGPFAVNYVNPADDPSKGAR